MIFKVLDYLALAPLAFLFLHAGCFLWVCGYIGRIVFSLSPNATSNAAFYTLVVGHVVVIWRRYVNQFGRPLDLKYDESNSFISNIVSKCECLTTKLYKPPLIGLYDTTGTLLTILGAFLKMHKFPKVTYERELYVCKDGGTIGLDWTGGDIPDSKDDRYRPDRDSEYNKNVTDPIIIVQHGNNGGSRISFVLHIAYRISQFTKWRVVVMLARGCSGIKLTTPQIYNTIHITDFEESVDFVRKRYPKAPLYALGWSLGATIVGRFVGETGKNCKLNGAVLVSPTWDFLLDKKMNTIWFNVWAEMALVGALKGNVRENRKELEELGDDGKVDIPAALKAASVREFDKLMQVPRSPYSNVDEYYEHASPAKYSHNITVPTLSINSQDDPITYIEAVREVDMGPGLVFTMPSTGGHCAMLELSDPLTNTIYSGSYPDRAIVEWFSVLEAERKNGRDWRTSGK